MSLVGGARVDVPLASGSSGVVQNDGDDEDAEEDSGHNDNNLPY